MPSVSSLPRVARDFLDYQEGQSVLAFHGEMGAGKTTFIKAICKALGVKDEVSSPTFSLVNEYRDSENRPVYHFDFYRINSEQEAYDMGVEEYFESGALCLVEWPEKIPSLLPHDCKHLLLTVNLDETRVLREIPDPESTSP